MNYQEKKKELKEKNKKFSQKNNNNLEEDIRELNEKLLRYPFELLEGEKIITLTIISLDENIRVNFICKNTDKFLKIKRKLYEEYPDYFYSEYFFTKNGKKIKENKNLIDNKIVNNDIIILNFIKE